MPYGYDDDPIAAQTMLRGYRPLDVGDLGDNYGVVDLSWLGPAISATGQIAGATVGAVSAGKQGRLAAQAAESQAEALAYQAQIQAEVEAAQTQRFLAALAAVSVLTLVLGGGYLYMRKG
jgi:hypothetical protein